MTLHAPINVVFAVAGQIVVDHERCNDARESISDDHARIAEAEFLQLQLAAGLVLVAVDV